MSAAQDGAPPPAILQVAWWCGDSKLPSVGGVLDQEYSMMVKMAAARNIYTAVMHANPSNPVDIHKLTLGERRILGSLRKEGLWRT